MRELYLAEELSTKADDIISNRLATMPRQTENQLTEAFYVASAQARTSQVSREVFAMKALEFALAVAYNWGHCQLLEQFRSELLNNKEREHFKAYLAELSPIREKNNHFYVMKGRKDAWRVFPGETLPSFFAWTKSKRQVNRTQKTTIEKAAKPFAALVEESGSLFAALAALGYGDNIVSASVHDRLKAELVALKEELASLKKAASLAHHKLSDAA